MTEVVPIGTVLEHGWIVANLRRHQHPGIEMLGVTAFCPKCSHPQRIPKNHPPRQCSMCTAQEGGRGQKKPKRTRGPEDWRSLVPAASEAFGADFVYAEEMAVWANLVAEGKALQEFRNHVE